MNNISYGGEKRRNRGSDEQREVRKLREETKKHTREDTRERIDERGKKTKRNREKRVELARRRRKWDMGKSCERRDE